MGQWEHADRSRALASLPLKGQPQFLSSIMSHVSLNRANTSGIHFYGVFGPSYFKNGACIKESTKKNYSYVGVKNTDLKKGNLSEGLH